MTHAYSSFTRVTALVLALLLALALVGCQPATPDTSDASEATSSTATSSTASSTTDSTAGTDSSTTVTTTPTAKPNNTVKPNNTTKPGGAVKPNNTTKETPKATTTTTVKVGPTTTRREPVAKDRYVQPQFYISTFKAVAQDAGGTYESFKKVIQLNKEAGINLVENAIMGHDESMLVAKVCEEVGMPFLLQNVSTYKGYAGMGANVPPISEDIIKEMVETTKNYQYLEGFFIWDEVSGTSFKNYQENVAKCKQIKTLFKKYDASLLTHAIALPSYGGFRWDKTDLDKCTYKKYVDEYVDNADPDIIGFDYYAFQMNGGENTDFANCSLWRDMGYMRKKAIETGKPFWFYIQGYDMDQGYTFTGPMLSVQMNCALAYGVKAVSYFTTLVGLVDKDGNKSPMYDTAKAVNKRVQNIGDLLFKADSKELYHFGMPSSAQQTCYLDDVADSELIKSAPNKTIVGVLKDSKKTYIVVASKDYKYSITGDLKLKKSVKLSRFNPETATTSDLGTVDRVSLNLAPGGVDVFIVE